MSVDPTIFVSIAAYRDTECPWTLKDLFAKAAKPHRVFAGVVNQVIEGEDEDCLEIPEQWKNNIRVTIVSAKESMGACWARSRVQVDHFRDEDYFLQVDSHSRFAESWDEKFIQMLKACRVEKPIVSVHPVGYIPPDKLTKPTMPIMVADRFLGHGVFIVKQRVLSLEQAEPRPRPNAFIGAGLIFTIGKWVREVPYDPYLYFQGEEISLSARSWTHGYDLFSPNDCLVFHDYTNRPRPKHWSDNRDWGKLHEIAATRLKVMLGMEKTRNAEALKEFNRYGLGNHRDLAQYIEFCDVNFKERTFGERAKLGNFAPPAIPRFEHEENRLAAFTEIRRTNGWGAEETRDGGGSTFGATQALRENLAEFFQKKQIYSVLDLGCGEAHWMRYLFGQIGLYVGLDIDGQLIERNRLLFRDRLNVSFHQADILIDPLPKVDLIVCRHVLTHLSEADNLAALQVIKNSGAKFVAMTTYPASAQNSDIKTGSWFQINLTKPPYNWAKPFEYLESKEDGSGPHLAVWELAR